MEYLKGGRGLIIGLVLGLVLAGSSTAVAAGLITSKQIKNGTIKLVDRAPGLREKIGASGPGATGPAGPVGPPGAPGAPGEKGPAGVFSAEPTPFVSSYRQPAPRSWSVRISWPNAYDTTDIGDPTYRAVAVCAKAG